MPIVTPSFTLSGRCRERLSLIHSAGLGGRGRVVGGGFAGEDLRRKIWGKFGEDVGEGRGLGMGCFFIRIIGWDKTWT